MRQRLDRIFRSMEHFCGKRLNLCSRLLILLAAVAIGLSFFFPLWHMHMEAPQYREGLDLYIYGHQLDAGNEGQDLAEINILNHYIGMQSIEQADFVEMSVIPFALGIFILLALRCIVFGGMNKLLDTAALLGYFTAFSLANFGYRMYSYGHNLDPRAPINPEPFWPALFGTKQIANMTVTSLPHGGSYCLAAAMLCLLAGMWCSRNEPQWAVHA